MALIKTLSGQFAKIKVIGVGGGGNNAINSMIDEDNIKGVDFISVNTDSQALLNSKAAIKIQLGEKLTKGLGAGGNPQIGQKAAEESREKIKELLADTDMAFICCGMGGGTGTGAAPIIAQIAKKELGILTIAVVTKPFLFEGTRRMTNAEEGISLLKENVDTLIIIPNQKVLDVVNTKATLLEAFKIADSVLNKGTKAISELITVPGLINLDFADIKAIMSNAGSALMGVGEAEGDNKVVAAVEAAIQSPLIEVDIDGARGVLINITGGPDLTMAEIEEAARTITEKTSPDANIIFGAAIEPELKGKIKITCIATGFDSSRPRLFAKPQSKPQSATQTHISQSISQSNQQQFQPVPSDDATRPTIDPAVQSMLGDTKLPAGIDIVDEFDVPSFMRKNQ